MKNVVILASGSGTNAENIIRFFENSKISRISWLLSNNPQALALDKAKALGVNTMVFTRDDFYVNGRVLSFLQGEQPDLIVLAGFLWLVPSDVVKAFPGRIINIHPALLPNYGGKGMYGDKVHKAVIDNKEKQSGITIHYVNEKYDDGDIIFQASCSVNPDDTPETLALKIHALEYEHFPKVILRLLE